MTRLTPAEALAMNILALDLGTRCGWALLTAHGRVESGTETFDLKRHESRGMRWVHFNRWLDEMLAHSGTVPRVGLVIYEKPLGRFATSGAAGEIALGMSTRIDEACARLDIDHTALPPATLKKWTTGKGNAGKPEMMAAVERRWGRRVDDDNEADAFALLMYAQAELAGAEAR